MKYKTIKSIEKYYYIIYLPYFLIGCDYMISCIGTSGHDKLKKNRIV